MMRRRTGGVLVLLCLLGTGLLALAPLARQLDGLTVHLADFFAHTVPIAPQGTSPADYGRILNVAFFVPVAAASTWALGPRWPWALPLCAGLSVAIELVQRLPALGRDSSAADVVCNCVGAAIGVMLVVVAGAVRRGRASASPPEGARQSR